MGTQTHWQKMHRISYFRFLPEVSSVRRKSLEMPHHLTAIAIPATASGVLLPGSKAVLAVHGPVTSRLKRHSGLLAAPGTRNGCSLRLAPLVSSAAALFVLLCLTASLAPFWRRIAAFLEKRLILTGKREFLSAVATGQLHTLCHKNPFTYSLTLR